MKLFLNILKYVLLTLILLIVLLVFISYFAAAIPAAIVIMVIVALITFSLRKGKAMVVKERKIVECQINSKDPIGFSKKRALMGYILMFSFLWILMSAVFLIPSSIAWVYILPPVTVVYIALCSIWKETWVILGFRKNRYLLMHVLGVSIPLFLVSVTKFIILYIKYKNNQI